MFLVDPLLHLANQNAGNMGQVCTATSRLYVQDTIYDKFLELFKKQTKENTTIGSQFDSNTNHGPQISKAAQEKILGYIESGKSEGAELIHGGTQSGIPDKGFFVEPAVFANVTNDMTIVREEVFGPFVVIQSFKTEEEVVAKANDTEFGLGAAVFTKDIMRGHRVAGDIEAGMVWVRRSRLTKTMLDSTDCFLDQQLTRLAFRCSVWWIQAERYWPGAGRVRSFIIHTGQSGPCQLGHDIINW
jgi:acyl-CoA reductase-like NAD-dependent aldehyde dehydrogenase